MILITGATGHFGTHTIDTLLKSGVAPSQIAALVRTPEKAAGLAEKGIVIRQGDYDDYASLTAAMQGVDKVLLISGADIQNRLKQHENVINAAKEAGIKHIVYTSFSRKNETENNPLGPVATSHIETDKLIRESGIPYTLMHNGLYFDVLPMFLGEQVLETGIFMPTGDGKTAFATRTDMAEAAAKILTTDGHENKTYRTVGSQNYTMSDIAGIISNITGKSISHVNPPAEVYKETLATAGVPGEFVWMLSAFSEGMRVGEFESSLSDLEQLLGRKPTSAQAFLESVYQR